MKLVFSIEYKTRWGEDLFLRSGEKSYNMSYVADGKWSVSVDRDEFFSGKASVEYDYEPDFLRCLTGVHGAENIIIKSFACGAALYDRERSFL